MVNINDTDFLITTFQKDPVGNVCLYELALDLAIGRRSIHGPCWSRPFHIFFTPKPFLYW